MQGSQLAGRLPSNAASAKQAQKYAKTSKPLPSSLLLERNATLVLGQRIFLLLRLTHWKGHVQSLAAASSGEQMAAQADGSTHRFCGAGNAQYCIFQWGKQMLGDTKLRLNWLPQSLWCLFWEANTSKKRTARFPQWCSALKWLERFPAPRQKIAWVFASLHHELQFYLISLINSGALCLQTADLFLHRFLNAFEKDTKQPYFLGKIQKQRGKNSRCLLLWKLRVTARKKAWVAQLQSHATFTTSDCKVIRSQGTGGEGEGSWEEICSINE